MTIQQKGDRMTPNIRLARQIRTPEGAIIRTEVGGAWIIPPDSPDFRKRLDYVKLQLQFARDEEPELDWHIETCGTERPWHRVQESEL